MGLCVQELEREGSPQQKLKLIPKEAQGCCQTSAVTGKTWGRGALEDLGLKENLILHTQDPEEVTLHLSSQPTNQTTN